MRMATTPQMTFSSQSQQFTWCCLRGTCSSWFLQNGARGDLGRLTPSRKQCPWQAGEAPGGRIPALHTPCELHTQDMEQGCSRALKHRKRQGHQHPGSGKGLLLGVSSSGWNAGAGVSQLPGFQGTTEQPLFTPVTSAVFEHKSLR